LRARETGTIHQKNFWQNREKDTTEKRTPRPEKLALEINQYVWGQKNKVGKVLKNRGGKSSNKASGKGDAGNREKKLA